jgi:large subunit ribosomal protein L33
MPQDNRIVLACTVCKKRNHNSKKNKKKLPKLILKKNCPACKTHTEHTEVKL